MDRAWQAILDQYGQPVELLGAEGEQSVSVRAFLQPVRK